MFNKQRYLRNRTSPISSSPPAVVRKVRASVNSLMPNESPAERQCAAQKNTIFNKRKNTLQELMERIKQGRFAFSTVDINGTIHHVVIDTEDSTRSIASLLTHPDRRSTEQSQDHPDNRRHSVICITGPDHGATENALLAELIARLLNKHNGEITDIMAAKLYERERCTWMVIELADILRNQLGSNQTAAELAIMLDGLAELMATDDAWRAAA